MVGTPENLAEFSAVGYFFAQDLHEKLGVPIGMVSSSWGGTSAQAWTSIDGFGKHPELRVYLDKAKKAMVEPVEKAVNQGHPTSLYNGMIAPIVPYAMKGVIWYQGESNRLIPSNIKPCFLH